MNIYATEEEQVEQIKKIWREYGVKFIAIIIIFLGIGYGWRYFQQYRLDQREQASVIYQAMMVGSDKPSQKENVKKDALKLKKDFSFTPYASFAALLLAKQAVAEGDFKQAKEELIWTLNHAKLAAVKQLAQLRLASVNLALGDTDAALKALSPVVSASFKPAIAELKGDIKLAIHKPAEANKAFSEALQTLPTDGLARPILQLKHDQYAAD